jgi:hypothetical protein
VKDFPFIGWAYLVIAALLAANVVASSTRLACVFGALILSRLFFDAREPVDAVATVQADNSAHRVGEEN